MQNSETQIVETSLSIYEEVRCHFKISNKNPHYDFHFRDIWKVFKGITRASPKQTVWAKDAVKLWYNENMRVYSDRLSTEEDKKYFKTLLQDKIIEFGFEQDEVLNS